MKSLGKALRILGPLAVGALVFIGPAPGGNTIASMREGQPLLVLILIVAMLVRWPRLWVLVPGFLVTRIAVGFGAVDWSSWVENTAGLQIIPLLVLIGVTSAVRRLPSPVPNTPGTIVPNADGVGSLLALPIVIPLSLTDRWALLSGLALAFALYRAFEYGRRSELWTRGRGWLAFLAAAAVMCAYCFYWARPDFLMGWGLAQRAGLVLGIVAWAFQRAVMPWRNRTTVP